MAKVPLPDVICRPLLSFAEIDVIGSRMSKEAL